MASDENLLTCTNADGTWNKGKYYKRKYKDGNNLYEVEIRSDIESFIENHSYNYLMLTNVLGEEYKIVGGVYELVKGSKYASLLKDRTLSYRVRSVGNLELLACNKYLVSSDGFYRNSKQSIDVEINLDTFLPVFDFVLYELQQPGN